VKVLRASHWRTDDVRSSALTAVRAAPTISRFLVAPQADLFGGDQLSYLSEVVVKDVVSPVIPPDAKHWRWLSYWYAA